MPIARPRAEPGSDSLRVIEDGAGSPAWNMAVDEALLRGTAAPTLRLYGWRPSAVSIGWFQSASDFADLPPGTPVVRRLTGGGAIHHAVELTFALAVDAGALPEDVDASYALLHDAVAAALAAVGVPVVRRTDGPRPGARPRSRWCFASAGRHDLVTADGRKLVGSAQRRVAQSSPRVLHHGSIVLEPPPLTPFAAAVAEFTDVPRALPRLRRELVAAIGRALDLRATAGAVAPAEARLAAALDRDRYADPAFVRSR
jgi:lipoate-protein ligase A